jgi:hypothetical protein
MDAFLHDFHLFLPQYYSMKTARNSDPSYA